MSDNNTSRGVYKQRETRPLDNPEIKRENDWWDEICKAHGEKNYRSKAKKTGQNKNSNKNSKKDSKKKK